MASAVVPSTMPGWGRLGAGSSRGHKKPPQADCPWAQPLLQEQQQRGDLVQRKGAGRWLQRLRASPVYSPSRDIFCPPPLFQEASKGARIKTDFRDASSSFRASSESSRSCRLPCTAPVCGPEGVTLLRAAPWCWVAAPWQVERGAWP